MNKRRFARCDNELLVETELTTLAKQHKSNLVIVDISMKELNGIEVTAQILAEVPTTRVLIPCMPPRTSCAGRSIGASGDLVEGLRATRFKWPLRHYCAARYTFRHAYHGLSFRVFFSANSNRTNRRQKR